MNERAIAEDLAKSLLNQDPFFSSPEYAEHRRAVMQRLAAAAEREKHARQRTVTLTLCCAVFFIAIYAWSVYETTHSVGWPGGFVTVLALLCILSPLTALLLFCLYFFRYRIEFIRARKMAREQAIADFSQQLKELRQELDALKKQRKPNTSPGDTGANSRA